MDINRILEKIDNQVWKKHPILKNVECSEFGFVRVDGKIRKCCLLTTSKPHQSFRGYFRVTVNKKSYPVSHLVYECFNGIIPEGFVIDHINTHPWDNRISNLRAVTQKENNRNPLTLQHLKKAKTRDCGYPVLQRDKKTDEIIGYFESISEANRMTGIDSVTIQRVCSPKWLHYKTAGGFKWERAKYRYSCKWGKWWISGDL